MTDLEITKACAEAMGHKPTGESGPTRLDFAGSDSHIWIKNISSGGNLVGMRGYDPFHNDDQAMALVKRFGLSVRRAKVPPHLNADYWLVYQVLGGTSGNNADLNRAICECVAKIPVMTPTERSEL